MTPAERLLLVLLGVARPGERRTCDAFTTFRALDLLQAGWRWVTSDER